MQKQNWANGMLSGAFFNKLLWAMMQLQLLAINNSDVNPPENSQMEET